MTQEARQTLGTGPNSLQEALHKLKSSAGLSDAPDSTIPNASGECPKCGFACRTGELICPNCLSVITRDEAYQAGSTNRLPEQEPGAGLVPIMPQRNQITLTIVETDNCLTLPSRDTLVIGRFSTDDGDFQPDVDLTLFGALNKGVSRRHLKLSRKEALVFVTDLGSTNGTFVNGHRLMPNLQRVLRSGDELRFGYLKVKIHF
jgi:hypothetical protein